MVMVGTDLHAELEDLVGWHRRNRATSVEQFTVRKGLCAGHRFEDSKASASVTWPSASAANIRALELMVQNNGMASLVFGSWQ